MAHSYSHSHSSLQNGGTSVPPFYSTVHSRPPHPFRLFTPLLRPALFPVPGSGWLCQAHQATSISSAPSSEARRIYRPNIANTYTKKLLWYPLLFLAIQRIANLDFPFVMHRLTLNCPTIVPSRIPTISPPGHCCSVTHHTEKSSARDQLHKLPILFGHYYASPSTAIC